MAGGECRIFSPPKYVVLGKTQYDQDYVDGEIEAGVGGCGFKRPLPRPALFDAPVARQIAAPAPAPRKKRFVQRVRDAVIRRPRPAPPVAEVPAVVPSVAVETAPAAPPPQDSVDALLHPRR